MDSDDEEDENKNEDFEKLTEEDVEGIVGIHIDANIEPTGFL